MAHKKSKIYMLIKRKHLPYWWSFKNWPPWFVINIPATIRDFWNRFFWLFTSFLHTGHIYSPILYTVIDMQSYAISSSHPTIFTNSK